ncbi:MAG: hypothetical protein PVF33_00265 [Candidatus Latescibacterota bacterium]|jgi:hypothetical protein
MPSKRRSDSSLTKNISVGAVICSSLFCLGAGVYEGFPLLEGEYMGQNRPGEVATVFAGGVLKPDGGFHSSVVFSPTGDEACWTNMHGVTYCSRLSEGAWNVPEALPFDPEHGVREPMYSGDGNRLYFLCRRPLPEDPVDRERIWYVDRVDDGWSAARAIDEVVAAHPTHWQFSFTANGTLYFTSEAPGTGGGQDIYFAEQRDGRFTSPKSVGDGVNTELREFCPFVAPDGTYLIFARTVPEERGRSDLFISFRNEQNVWSRAVNMGDAVNTLHNEVSPVVTPDGKYLFFLRVSGEVNDVFWVTADVIHDLQDSSN